MKHVQISDRARTDAPDRDVDAPRRRQAKLALVRPIVAPVEEYVPASADPRDSFESAALTVMREFQRLTFYR